MSNHRTYFIGLITALVLSPHVASAVPTLSAPVLNITLHQSEPYAYESYTLPGSYNLGGISTTVSFSPATLTGRVVGGAYGNSLEDILSYAFAVVGPEDGITVPMFVSASLSVSTVGSAISGGASARFSLYHDGHASSPDIFNEIVQTAPGQPRSFSDTLSFDFISGQIGGVGLQIDASAFPGLISEAFADPYIYIDPDFLVTNPGYSVIVSAGIGNQPRAVEPPTVVPEPATMLLFCTGLAGLVGTGLRRKKQ